LRSRVDQFRKIFQNRNADVAQAAVAISKVNQAGVRGNNAQTARAKVSYRAERFRDETSQNCDQPSEEKSKSEFAPSHSADSRKVCCDLHRKTLKYKMQCTEREFGDNQRGQFRVSQQACDEKGIDHKSERSNYHGARFETHVTLTFLRNTERERCQRDGGSRTKEPGKTLRLENVAKRCKR